VSSIVWFVAHTSVGGALQDDKSRRAGSKGMTEYQSSNFDMFVRFPMGAFEFHFKQTTKPQVCCARHLGTSFAFHWL
jgi:hypothetical protein